MSHPHSAPGQSIEQALTLLQAGSLDEAEKLYREILARDRNQPDVLCNLANVLKGSGRIEEAVELCREAIRLAQQNAAIHSSLCFKLLFNPSCDRAAIFAQQSEWNRRHGRKAAHAPTDFQPNRRLRVGYVSPDFYGQAECFFVIPLLRAHDRRKIEVHCYSSTANPDKATDLIRRCAESWHDVRDLNDDQLADKIRADKMDVLVDLTMHMAFNRLPVFAQKPAPVQVTWLAYPGGTGLDAIDYRLTDQWIDPPGTDSFYSETSIRLPQTWCCYDPLGNVPPARVGDFRPITFGCLNNPCKLNRPSLALWRKVLKAVPESRMILLSHSQSQRQEIIRELGIDPSRIEFTGHLRRGEYLRLYDRIDICLDPLIYNGITTTCDALWMGVPVITRVGPTAAGRAGLSILSNVGLNELIAGDDEEFVSIARELAENHAHRTRLRESLRDRFRHSPMMDADQFARNVEAAYLKMAHAV